MVRNYTQKTKDRLLKQIKEIENESQNSFLDTITDLLKHLQVTLHCGTGGFLQH